jgi:hypothetical protein
MVDYIVQEMLEQLPNYLMWSELDGWFPNSNSGTKHKLRTEVRVGCASIPYNHIRSTIIVKSNVPYIITAPIRYLYSISYFITLVNKIFNVFCISFITLFIPTSFSSMLSILFSIIIICCAFSSVLILVVR